MESYDHLYFFVILSPAYPDENTQNQKEIAEISWTNNEDGGFVNFDTHRTVRTERGSESPVLLVKLV